MSAGPLSPVTRGAAVGLVAGLVLGGLALIAVGTQRLWREQDCAAELPAEQCALEVELSLSLARRQTLFGSALALLGLGGVLLIRGQLRRANEEVNR